MFFHSIFIVGLLFLSVGTQYSSASSEEVACGQCMHLSFTLGNMPTLYRMILNSVLSRLNLANPDCESNSIEPESCPAPPYPTWMETKCSTVTVTLSAVGITGVLPDAEMTVTVVSRDCINQMIGENSDGCTNFADLDASAQAQITQQLQSLESSWDSVSYTGQICIETP